jgi:diguanylate cyclase
MVQHQLAPNPINYSLWYHYVSARSPELNTELDHLIDTQGSYSAAQSVTLFRRYILAASQVEQKKTAAKLQTLAKKLLTQLGESIDSSGEFDRELQRCATTLQSAAECDTVMQMVNSLVDSIATLSESSRCFQWNLRQAQQDVQQLKTELQHSQHEADRDALTQLYNRQALTRELECLLRDQHCAGHISLIFCDVDYFKRCNDEYGHLFGDRVLQRIGALILDHSPRDAIAARFGGEEFAIVLPATTLCAAAELAEQLRHRMEQLQIKVRKSDRVLDKISASFGVASSVAGDSVDSFLDRADQALYAAKRAGRNRVHVESSAQALENIPPVRASGHLTSASGAV